MEAPLTTTAARAGIAGFSCAVVSAPLNVLDVCKVRQQNARAGTPTAEYRGFLPTALKIWREEGALLFTRGMTPSMLRELSYSSIRIGGYEPVRAALSRNAGSHSDSSASGAVKYASGIVSGGIGAALAHPFDLARVTDQAALPGVPRRGVVELLVGVRRREGLAGLYRGWTVTTARAAVLTSSQVGTYDYVKHNILVRHFGMEEGVLLHLCASMLAGLATTTATSPFDVLRTRVLASDATSPAGVALHVLRTEGLSTFFRGWIPNYCRLGPHTVASFLLIETLRNASGVGAL